MKQNIFNLALVLVTLFLGVVVMPQTQAQASPGIIYVPDDYPTIQGAVDAASPGDTIIVRDGDYTENIIVTKDHLTIKSENGAGSTIVDMANSGKGVFEVRADYVSLIGFTVNGAAGEYQAGIYLTESSYCNIRDNTAIGNYYGICLEDSGNNAVTNNTVKWNSQDGILLGISSNNTVTNNTANENHYFGIRVYFSGSNTLRNNSMSHNRCNFYSWGWALSELRQDVDISNKVDGRPIYYLVDKPNQVIDSSTNAGYVAVVNSTNITVKDLTLTHSGFGVLFAYTNNSRIENITGCYDKHSFLLYHSNNNMVINNFAGSNIYDGFRIWSSNNNTFINNTSNWNSYGAYLDSSDNNVLINNTASNSSEWGICSRNSNNNTIYLNNVLNGTLGNVLSALSTNIWNSTEKLTYAYNGTNYTGYLGNYWSDYESKYPDAGEIGSAGIWDIPYSIRVTDHAVPQADDCPLLAPVSRYLLTENLTGAAPSWLSRYWWTIVVGVMIVVLLVYFLWWRKRA